MRVLLVAALLCGIMVPASAFLRQFFVDNWRALQMTLYGPETWPPSFCNDLECPRFTVLESHDAYEVRQYNASQWVTTYTDNDYDTAQYDLYTWLADYMDGGNVKKSKLNMTCPVIGRLTPGPWPAVESNITMAFYIPPDVEAPAPTGEGVYLINLPSMRVYVKSFSGFSSLNKYLTAAAQLTEDLPTGTLYHTDFWYVAGYDSPHKMLDRHNEVWFIGL